MFARIAVLFLFVAGVSTPAHAGYRIVYGSSAQQLTQTIQVANAGLSSHTSSGAESSESNVMARVVQ